jgi:hypothetical protein
MHPVFSDQGKHKIAMAQECRIYETFGVQLAFTRWLGKSLRTPTGGHRPDTGVFANQGALGIGPKNMAPRRRGSDKSVARAG